MDVPKCRSCGAAEANQKIRANYVFGGSDEHNFWQCNKCELVYLWPLPTEEEEHIFYAQEFEKFMSDRSAEDRDWSGAEAHIISNQDNVQRRFSFLKEYLRKDLDVLEIGCSSGFMMDAFREYGSSVVGVEPSNKFTGFLESKGYEIYSDLRELVSCASGKKFDLIVHFFVLEHIRDTKAFIEQQINLLKPGGMIIAEVPCVNDPLTSLYNIPAFEKFYWSIAHYYYFSPRSLSCILDKLGLNYELFPEQRYDLSNHIVWMTDGKSGGQGRFKHVFSQELIEKYKDDLKEKWLCDTMFVVIDKA